MYKRRIRAAALAAAMLFLAGCEDNSTSVEEAAVGQAEVSEADNGDSPSPGIVGGTAETSDVPEYSNGSTGRKSIKPPTDEGKLSILVSTASAVNYEAAAELFESLGGTAELTYCAENNLYDSITSSALADKPVDIASFDNGLMYPYAVSQSMLEPIEKAVDLNSQRWYYAIPSANMFKLSGWHYVLPFSTYSARALYYYSDMIVSVTGIDPADYVASGEWTTAKLDEIIDIWHSKGGDKALAGDWGTPMYLRSGSTVVTYDEETAGFSNNSFDPKIAKEANRLYKYKADGRVVDAGFMNVTDALDHGALFYSAGYEEAKRKSMRPQLSAVPIPTDDGSQSVYYAKIDGAVLVKGIKNNDSARCFFECASTVSALPQGELGESFLPPYSAKAVYPYGLGIAPKLSSDSKKPDDGFPHAAVPLMYSAPYYTDVWDQVCIHFTEPITSELSALNNRLRAEIAKNDAEK